MEKIKILELFGGIGAPRKAFKNLNIDVETIYVENTKKVVDIYNLFYNDNQRPSNVVDFKGEKNQYDFLFAGFPCQPFSLAGKKLGFNDPRGQLYKEVLRIIKETLPKNIVLENVKGILNDKNIWILDEIVEHLENLGYDTRVLKINSKDFNYIQSRERVFIVASFEIKDNINLLEKKVNRNVYKKTYKPEEFLKWTNYDLGSVLDRKNCYYIPHKTPESFKADGSLNMWASNRVWKINEQKLGTINCTTLLKIGVKYENKLYYRNLTPKESLLYMDFDENDYNLIKDKIAKSNIYFVAGNSMVVGVIETLISYLLNI